MCDAKTAQGININMSPTSSFLNALTTDAATSSIYTTSSTNSTKGCCYFELNAERLCKEILESQKRLLEELKKPERIKEETYKWRQDLLTEKSENKMNIKKILNFDCGPISLSEVGLSIYGPAFHTSDDRWVSFKNDEYFDVTEMLFDIGKSICYVLPVAKSKINLGDFIKHNKFWARVIDVDDSERLVVEDVCNREVKTIMPTKNAFGFDFYVKLYNPFNDFSKEADKDNPFGSMMPLLMMGGESDNSLMMMAMMQKDSDFFKLNPIMMFLMNDKSDKSNLFKDMLLMQMLQKNKD